MKKFVTSAIRFYQRQISPLSPPPLPLYPHLLGVRSGGGGEVRRRQGELAGRQAHPAVQPLPQGRV